MGEGNELDEQRQVSAGWWRRRRRTVKEDARRHTGRPVAVGGPLWRHSGEIGCNNTGQSSEWNASAQAVGQQPPNKMKKGPTTQE